MTTARCHYDHALSARVIPSEHRDDCTSPDTHRGCVLCTAGHCRICGREHVDNAHPQTCPDCVAKVREDLTDIRIHRTHLRPQAACAGARRPPRRRCPIPDALAQVLIGPA